jgi:hypothetical protein
MARAVAKRKADRVPARAVGAWALLQDAINDTLPERPEGSVTPEEFATAAHVGYFRACQVLRAREDLRAVYYRRENGRRAVCYVEAT